MEGERAAVVVVAVGELLVMVRCCSSHCGGFLVSGSCCNGFGLLLVLVGEFPWWRFEGEEEPVHSPLVTGNWSILFVNCLSPALLI